MENWRTHYKKALTFSYDDGVEADLKLLEILNRYGMKCTFNLNSGITAEDAGWEYKGHYIKRLNLWEHVKDYEGHEIAVHCYTHQSLTEIDKDAAIVELAKDKAELTRIFGQEPVGMAYPYGTYNDEVEALVKAQGLRYGRTVESTHDFKEQSNLIAFKPTCHHEDDMLFELAQKFLDSNPAEPQIFYLWGHSYEFQANENWDRLERFCQMLAGKEDIFYGTNAQVLL